jgi:chromosome condensin MukBEF ATPase and DNA-binding subunit MukB
MASTTTANARTVRQRMERLQQQLHGELQKLSMVERELAHLELQLQALQHSLRTGELAEESDLPILPESPGADRWGPH